MRCYIWKQKKKKNKILEREKMLFFFLRLKKLIIVKKIQRIGKLYDHFQKKNTDKSKYGLSKNGNNKNSGEKIKKLTYENVK